MSKTIRQVLEKVMNYGIDQALETKSLEPWDMMSPDQAQQAIKDILMECVGEDDSDVRGTTQNTNNPKYWTKRTKARNELREEIRANLLERLGDKGE